MPTLPFPPHAVILLFTTGLALVYLELNRPGLILPGATGLLAILLAFASIVKSPHPGLPALLLLAALLLLYRDDRRPNTLTACLAAALLMTGFRQLSLQPSLPIRLTAIACATAIAFGTHVLNRLAFQARLNKGAVKTANPPANS